MRRPDRRTPGRRAHSQAFARSNPVAHASATGTAAPVGTVAPAQIRTYWVFNIQMGAMKRDTHLEVMRIGCHRHVHLKPIAHRRGWALRQWLQRLQRLLQLLHHMLPVRRRRSTADRQFRHHVGRIPDDGRRRCGAVLVRTAIDSNGISGYPDAPAQQKTLTSRTPARTESHRSP